MRLRERAEKYVSRRCEYLPGKFYSYEATVTINPKEAWLAGFREACRLALEGVEREKQYHEFLDEKGEMRHPILACKEIAGYIRALAEGEHGKENLPNPKA